jgi:hypothetical protein
LQSEKQENRPVLDQYLDDLFRFPLDLCCGPSAFTKVLVASERTAWPLRCSGLSPDGKLIEAGTHGVHGLVLAIAAGRFLHSLERHFEHVSSVTWAS